MNPILNQPQQFNANGFMQQLQQLRQNFKGDPNQYIQQMLNSGRISQQQYNAAVQQAQNIMRMLNGKA